MYKTTSLSRPSSRFRSVPPVRDISIRCSKMHLSSMTLLALPTLTSAVCAVLTGRYTTFDRPIGTHYDLGFLQAVYFLCTSQFEGNLDDIEHDDTDQVYRVVCHEVTYEDWEGDQDGVHWGFRNADLCGKNDAGPSLSDFCSQFWQLTVTSHLGKSLMMLKRNFDVEFDASDERYKVATCGKIRHSYTVLSTATAAYRRVQEKTDVGIAHFSFLSLGTLGYRFTVTHNSSSRHAC